MQNGKLSFAEIFSMKRMPQKADEQPEDAPNSRTVEQEAPDFEHDTDRPSYKSDRSSQSRGMVKSLSHMFSRKRQQPSKSKLPREHWPIPKLHACAFKGRSSLASLVQAFIVEGGRPSLEAELPPT